MFGFGLSFFFVLLFSSSVAATTTTTAQPYIPNDVIFLNCGSTDVYSSSSHAWADDQDSMFVPFDINTTSFSSVPDNQDTSIDDVPYSTARFFNTSPFTYTFPISTGPKFLRLHFYPTTYNDLNTEQSFFSVSSNGYSLLTNFSAFLAASFMAKTHSDARVNMPNVPRVVKEFLVHVNDTQTLNVTFTPSDNSLAFINGIEIVSMPENLYFKYKGLNYVGMSNGPVIGNHTALENIYRLNMGGEQIPVKDDTMYRSWDQDNNYVHGGASRLELAYHSPVIYTKETPDYIAPEVVYQSQRCISDQSDNKSNLTWILPVDSGFYYMLRLHFCNIILTYTKKGDVTFRIFINNQTVEQEADVFNWTQGSGYPVFKDYIVFVNDTNGRGSKQDLWLAMYPNPKPEGYGDAYLNGLEAFKLSMDNSLASPNPEPSSTTTPIVKENNNKTPYAVIIGGIGGALVLFSVLVFVVFQRRRRAKHYGAADNGSSARCRRLSLTEVKEATDEFSESFVIGNGGFGKVYKGYIDNKTTVVAIKRLDSSSKQGFQEFRTEIKMLSKLRHVQLVSLIGYCDDEGEMILVYDYMAHGTLREHLYNTNKPPLSWKRRLDICIGVAKGLHYLHSGGKHAIIHGDVKSTNILLDENWVAKLSDFGLSKLGSEDHSETHHTVVKGSLGYIDPEYCWTQRRTKKSDVYSFGVVLLEVLCGRPVIVEGLREEEVSLVEWGKTCYQKGALHKIIDPKLSGEIAPGCMRKFGDVASKCLHEEGSERPAMEEVVWRLEFALQLQEDSEKVDGPNTVVTNQELSFIV